VLTKLQQKQLAILGANICHERMRREMTQERLAELMELNVRTVQKIEAGQTNVLIMTTLRFKKALKCDRRALRPLCGADVLDFSVNVCWANAEEG